MVLHTADESVLDTALAGLSKAGLPNLWIPRREHCVRVTAIPVLGTGKPDLRALKQLAQELTSVSK